MQILTCERREIKTLDHTGNADAKQKKKCEESAGVTCDHAKKLQEWADENDVVVIVRISTSDTVREWTRVKG